MSQNGSREVGVPLGLDAMVSAMRAASEDTRLRVLVLLAQGELSVSDLTDILGQSQPRISRHLKVMVEAGLVERHREGAWAFFRIAESGAGPLLQPILHGLDPDDPATLTLIRKRVGACLWKMKQAGHAQEVAGVGDLKGWIRSN